MIRSRWIAPVLALAISATACNSDDGSGPPRVEPNVATMRLSIGNRTIDVNASNGTVTGGPITLGVLQSSLVTVTFLRTNGSADPLVVAPDYELRVDPASGSNLTFSRTGPFSGTLRGSTIVNTSATFRLHSVDHGHSEFGFPVPINVVSAEQ